MDKFAVIRSIVGATGGHDAYQCTTGWPQQSLAAIGGRPSIGSVAGEAAGPGRPVGAAVRRPGREDPARRRGATPARPGSSARTFGAFKPSGPDLANMMLNADQPGPPGRPQDAARRVRRPPPRPRRERRARRDGRPHRAGARRAHLQQAGRRPRPVAGGPARSATATATASRTSSSTTAPRRPTTSS